MNDIPIRAPYPYDLDQVQVTRKRVEHAADYLRAAIEFYPDERSREKAIQGILDLAIGQDGDWDTRLGWADDIRPNCSWWHEAFLVMVLELKNVLGLAGNPILQAIVDYSKIISKQKYTPFRDFCNFPTVLIGVAETRLDISIAVYVGEIHVTKLLTLDTTSGFLISDNIVRLARVFTALSSCRQDLISYYGEVQRNSRLTCVFPNPTPMDPSDKLPVLAYKKFLSRSGQLASVLVDLGNTTTAMYTATLNGTVKEVVVKFTARYNEAAHRILAKAGFAPELHFCARVVGGLYMVVMDRVDGKSLWELHAKEKKQIPPIVMEHVRQAVDLLHGQNIVFGDLRDPNILYIVPEDRAVLVDFDWPGQDGVSRYPAAINHANTWAEGVGPYDIMTKAHDIWQLARLEKLCQTGT